jgi:fructan beta-fructosidase
MILAAGNHVRIYTSDNLKDWNFASTFGEKSGSHAGVWECPDLFELPVGSNPDEAKWVMIVSIGNEETHTEGSRTQYFIGDFNGKTFINHNSDEKVLWIDHGRDNYAGVTWSNIPDEDERRIFLGWMSNWKYAHQTPTKAWRGAMTLPRELKLAATKGGVRLFQTPIIETDLLRKEKLIWENRKIDSNDDNNILDINGKTIEIIAVFELNTSSAFGFKVRKSEEEQAIIGYNVNNESLFIDRRHSGELSFNPFFADKHMVTIEPIDNKVKLHLFIDWSSVEVFANNGELVMTDLIFPAGYSEELELFASDGDVQLVSLEIYRLASIWE